MGNIISMKDYKRQHGIALPRSPYYTLDATPEQIHSRIRRQLPAEEVMQRADHVILNYEGNPRARQVQHIHSQLLVAAEKKAKLMCR